MSDKPKYTAAELVQKAEECVTVCELDLAHKFYTRALALEPENTSIMDDTAQVLLDMGEPEEAAELLAKSITLAPRSGFLKYLNMAQLLEGRDSLNSYNTAVQIMLEEHEAALKNHVRIAEWLKIFKQFCIYISLSNLYRKETTS
jgi:predicted Zn-dependent protease